MIYCLGEMIFIMWRERIELFFVNLWIDSPFHYGSFKLAVCLVNKKSVFVMQNYYAAAHDFSFRSLWVGNLNDIPSFFDHYMRYLELYKASVATLLLCLLEVSQEEFHKCWQLNGVVLLLDESNVRYSKKKKKKRRKQDGTRWEQFKIIQQTKN